MCMIYFPVLPTFGVGAIDFWYDYSGVDNTTPRISFRLDQDDILGPTHITTPP